MSSRPPGDPRRTLPARVYTDRHWFSVEMERIFAGMWIAAGRAGDLAAPGRFVRREVAGASVLVIRTGEGGVKAFHNVCRHRGTRLCTQETGQLSGSIQCPYHAWTYGLDGLLLGAPQMDEVAGFDKADYPLREVHCAEWDGHLFINLSEAAAPLASQLRDLPSRFAPWRMQDLRTVHRAVYDVATNWKLVVQNYNECLHCPVIHPLLNRMHHYLGADNVPTTDSYCGGAMGLRDGVETLSTDGKRRRAVLPGLGERERAIVNYFAIYPNLLLTLHPDYMMTITIWPQDAGHTRLIAEWHFHPDEIAKPDFVYEDAIEFWDRTNREDWEISEQSYLGISSRGYSPGPYSERETQLWEFDQFVLSRTGQPL
ncbi:MAG: aromatic ring-hydroxylating dioxygenase subunit alpha [Vicinamibacterales bacterium]